MSKKQENKKFELAIRTSFSKEDTGEKQREVPENSEQVELTTEQMKDQNEAEIEQKRQEIQAKVDAYKLAQKRQLLEGGPGPVADEETMKIVNEYGGEFEVKQKD